MRLRSLLITFLSILSAGITCAQTNSAGGAEAWAPPAKEIRETITALKARVGQDGFTSKMVNDLRSLLEEISDKNWNQLPMSDRQAFHDFYRNLKDFASGRTNGTTIVAQLQRGEAAELSFRCMNKLRLIGISFDRWASANGQRYPFHILAAQQGTAHLRIKDVDGFDQNSAAHFQVLSNHLNDAEILVCPMDPLRTVAKTLSNLRPVNVSYRINTAAGVNARGSEEVLAWCPVHEHVLLCDGVVFNGKSAAGMKVNKSFRGRTNN